jgi:hypothetical protein
VIAEPTVNAAESIGHFDYLYYKGRKLSQTNRFTIAPSGRQSFTRMVRQEIFSCFDVKAKAPLNLRQRFPDWSNRSIGMRASIISQL